MLLNEWAINCGRELIQKEKEIELSVKMSESELVLKNEGKDLVLLTNHPYLFLPSVVSLLQVLKARKWWMTHVLFLVVLKIYKVSMKLHVATIDLCSKTCNWLSNFQDLLPLVCFDWKLWRMTFRDWKMHCWCSNCWS